MYEYNIHCVHCTTLFYVKYLNFILNTQNPSISCTRIISYSETNCIISENLLYFMFYIKGMSLFYIQERRKKNFVWIYKKMIYLLIKLNFVQSRTKSYENLFFEAKYKEFLRHST